MWVDARPAQLYEVTEQLRFARQLNRAVSRAAVYIPCRTLMRVSLSNGSNHRISLCIRLFVTSSPAPPVRRSGRRSAGGLGRRPVCAPVAPAKSSPGDPSCRAERRHLTGN